MGLTILRLADLFIIADIKEEILTHELSKIFTTLSPLSLPDNIMIPYEDQSSFWII